MKWYALILSILISLPPVTKTVIYLMDDVSIIMDGSMGEEEKEERETNDAEEKDKEFNLEYENDISATTIDRVTLNANTEHLLRSQYYTEDFSPPPEV